MFKKSLVIMARALLAAWLVSSISACAKKTPASSTSTESAATATATSSMAAVPAKMTPSDLWKLMGKKLTYIQEGHHGPVVYDFTDTNCPFCHLIYVVEARLIREGKLTVRYVPVAIIKPSSMPEAAAILQADNPVAALQKAEDAIGKGMKTGQPAKLARATDAIGKASPKTIEAIKKIEANDVFLQEVDIDELPDIIYLPKKGKLGLITGLISEKKLTELLPQMQ